MGGQWRPIAVANLRARAALVDLWCGWQYADRVNGYQGGSHAGPHKRRYLLFADNPQAPLLDSSREPIDAMRIRAAMLPED
jgi:hypothetical protein